MWQHDGVSEAPVQGAHVVEIACPAIAHSNACLGSASVKVMVGAWPSRAARLVWGCTEEGGWAAGGSDCKHASVVCGCKQCALVSDDGFSSVRGKVCCAALRRGDVSCTACRMLREIFCPPVGSRNVRVACMYDKLCVFVGKHDVHLRCGLDGGTWLMPTRCLRKRCSQVESASGCPDMSTRNTSPVIGCPTRRLASSLTSPSKDDVQ